jgi:hypothetical protein
MNKYLQKIMAVMVIGFSVHAQNSGTAKQTKKDTVIRSIPSPLPDPPFPTSDWDGAPYDFIRIRPELSYAPYVTSYHNGTKKDLFTAAMDLIPRI